ncbi:MAG: hypothetical protein AAGI01_17765, partial [Myxococcota bacterium]
PPAPPLAHVGEQPITQADLRRYLRAHPKATPREGLDALIERELLVRHQLADTTAPDRRTSIRLAHAQRQGLARAWMAEEIEPFRRPKEVTDTMLTQATERSVQALTQGEGLEVSHLLIYVPSKRPDGTMMTTEEREQLFPKARESAERLRATLSTPTTAAELLRIVEERTFTPPAPLTLSMDLHLRFLRPGATGRSPQGATRVLYDFAAAADKLTDQPGIPSQPVRTGFGWHIIVFERILPPVAPDRAKLQKSNEAEVTRATRRKRFEEQMDALLKRSAASKYPEELKEQTRTF